MRSDWLRHSETFFPASQILGQMCTVVNKLTYPTAFIYALAFKERGCKITMLLLKYLKVLILHLMSGYYLLYVNIARGWSSTCSDMFCKQLLFPQYLHTNLVHFQGPMKIVQFPTKMNSKMGPTMGRALIGCCPMATANRSSPHSGPILSFEE